MTDLKHSIRLPLIKKISAFVSLFSRKLSQFIFRARLLINLETTEQEDVSKLCV